MARRETLAELLTQVQNEMRSSSNTSRGVDHLENLKQLIRRTNEMITSEYDWPYMKLPKSLGRVDMQAGERYYDFPEELDQETITKVWYREGSGNQWYELEQGVGPAEYAQSDSDNDERSDVVLKWDFVVDEDGNEQFEVWPMPASDNGQVWFEGRKLPNPMNTNSSRSDHDAILIVLRVAAEALSSRDKKDAQIKASAAAARMDRLKVRYASRKTVSLGAGYPRVNKRTRVLVARTESEA